VPVELATFDAKAMNNSQVLLSWTTLSESNNLGFEVQRKEAGGEFEKVGFVQGAGTTSQPQNYTFVDRALSPESYSYRLRQIDFDGSFEYSQTIKIEVPAPKNFVLNQNHPNPFNAATKLKFELPEASHVVIKIFNTEGQEIKTLINQTYAAGRHEVIWDGLTESKRAAASGLYLYRIHAKDFVKTKKMILLK